MPTLVDTIDRLAGATSSIRRNLRDATPYTSGPYSTALFNPDIQSVIRDIDESEIGLFSLDTQPLVVETAVPEVTVSRAKTVEATPLRKRRVRTREVEEYDPEVYAEAALRYLHK